MGLCKLSDSLPMWQMHGGLPKLEFDVGSVGAREREHAWASIMRHCFYDFSTSYPVAFHDGQISCSRVGPVCNATFTSDPMTASRESTHIARDPQDHYFVVMPGEGALSMRQRGRQAVIRQGEMTLVSTALPYVYQQVTRETFRVMMVPGATVRAHCVGIDDFAAIRFPSSGLVRLFLDFASSLQKYASELPADAASGLSEHLCELLALVVAGADHESSESSVRFAHRRRALALVESRFSDPEFSPAVIARALRISARYLQRIFAENGETPLGVIRRRRIAEACLLLDKRGRNRGTIAEIAYAVGFNDPAYFSRMFRAESGASPSDYTRQ